MTPDWLAFRFALNGHLIVRRIVCIIPHLYPEALKAKAKPKAHSHKGEPTADKAQHVFAAVCVCGPSEEILDLYHHSHAGFLLKFGLRMKMAPDWLPFRFAVVTVVRR